MGNKSSGEESKLFQAKHEHNQPLFHINARFKGKYLKQDLLWTILIKYTYMLIHIRTYPYMWS